MEHFTDGRPCECELVPGEGGESKRVWCWTCIHQKAVDAHAQADPEMHQRVCINGEPRSRRPIVNVGPL